MTERYFEIWDVFTDRLHAGNPLAVVMEANGLDTDRMQKIAAEFNLSETAFVFPPLSPQCEARLRIFTPGFELPFAGHPTVGSAIALARARGLTDSMKLELPAGLFEVKLSQENGIAFAEFTNPKLPSVGGPVPAGSIIEAAMSLQRGAIIEGTHRPRRIGAGVDYIYACASLAHVQSARLNHQAWEQLNLDGAIGLLLYAKIDESISDAPLPPYRARFHVRMFAPGAGIMEDPATGSAAAALPGQIQAASRLSDGTHLWQIDQGAEMGRPSRINVTVEVVDGVLAKVRVGGTAVRVAEGRLLT